MTLVVETEKETTLEVETGIGVLLEDMEVETEVHTDKEVLTHLGEGDLHHQELRDHTKIDRDHDRQGTEPPARSVHTVPVTHTGR